MGPSAFEKELSSILSSVADDVAGHIKGLQEQLKAAQALARIDASLVNRARVKELEIRLDEAKRNARRIDARIKKAVNRLVFVCYEMIMIKNQPFVLRVPLLRLFF